MEKKVDMVLKALCIILLVCILILTYLATIGIIFFRKVSVPIFIYTNKSYWETYDKLYNEYDTSLTPLCKSDYREIIEDQNNLKFYFYTEKELTGSYNGFTFPTIRLIQLDSTLKDFEYAVVFTHETMHLTKMIKNERYICFETFKYLYESDVEELHNAGVWYGIRQLEFRYSEEYQCEDLVIGYLQGIL